MHKVCDSARIDAKTAPVGSHRRERISPLQVGASVVAAPLANWVRFHGKSSSR